MGICQLYGLARGAPHRLRTEGEALRGEHNRNKFIGSHLHDGGRDVIAIDDAGAALLETSALICDGSTHVTTNVQFEGRAIGR